MEKRVIIAVILSIIVIVLWQRFFGDIQPVIQQAPPLKEAATMTDQEFAQETKKGYEESIPHAEEEKYVLETEQFIITFSNIGGCIKKIELKEYKDGEKETFYALMSEGKTGRGIFNIKSKKLNLENDNISYRLKAEQNIVEYSTILPGQVKVIKRYIFRGKDIINFEIAFENLDPQAHTFDYDITGGVGIEAKEPFANRYIQVDAKVSDVIYRDRGTRRKGILFHPGDVQWSALKNKYFVLIIKPFSASGASFVEEHDRVLASGVRMAAISLSPGSKITHQFLLYAGPKKPDRLTSLNMGFEEIIYYGIFGSISKMLLSILRIFYKFTHNWGMSIIMLAAIMNLLLYPLTRKSLKSMQKMQALQPAIKELQGKYKKSPQKLNREIMELYKKHKVNPLGGCFPMLLQMPVFIALYQGLIRFIELKNANFLWIKDLSLPDSVTFPFLGGKAIHILPILMAGTMFLQQKFSHPQHQAGLTEQQRQQQRMMSFMMPFLFGFIFYNFPSGLVLYWFTNTLFMTLNQIAIMKKAI